MNTSKEFIMTTKTNPKTKTKNKANYNKNPRKIVQSQTVKQRFEEAKALKFQANSNVIINPELRASIGF